MSEPTTRLDSSRDEPSSIEPWLVPVVAAGVAGGGLATVSVVFGTVMWLVMRAMVKRGNLEEPMLSIIGWLIYVLFSAPAIALTLRSFVRKSQTLST